MRLIGPSVAIWTGANRSSVELPAESGDTVDAVDAFDAAETGRIWAPCGAACGASCELTIPANSGSLERNVARLVTAAVSLRDVSSVIPSMEFACSGVRPGDSPESADNQISISSFGRTKAAGRTGGTAGIFIVLAEVADSESWRLGKPLWRTFPPE